MVWVGIIIYCISDASPRMEPSQNKLIENLIAQSKQAEI